MNDDLTPTPPSFPPPRTTGSEPDPLSYATLPSKFGQRVAEASWIACGLSILMGFFANMAHPQSPGAIRAIALTNDGLIIAGFVCSLVALLGNRWWKSRDIVRPAMTGLLLSVALIALTARARIVATRQLEERQREFQMAQQKELAQKELQAFLLPSWFTIYQAQPVVLTVRNLPPEVVSSGILSDLGLDASVVSFSVSNTGAAETTLDVTGAVLTLEDGSQQPSMDTVQVLSGARRNREPLLRLYTPPLRIPSGKAASALVFFPPTVDWKKVSSIAVRINGASHVISGRFLSEEEKRQFMPAYSQPATQSSP